MEKRSHVRFSALCLIFTVLAAVFAVPALAAVPERPANMVVLDEAGVLSESTEREIIEGSSELFERTGAEIVIVAVDFLGGREIDDYAYDLFNEWGIGSAQRNNGLLLVLAIGEDNYYAQAGYGIEDYFDRRLQELLDDYLEPDFAAGDYDAGVKKFFHAALSELNTYYAEDEYNDQPYEDHDLWAEPIAGRSGLMDTVFRFFGRVILVVLIVVIIVLLLRLLRRGGGGGGGGIGGGGGGGFWRGMFLGGWLSNRRRRSYYIPPVPRPVPPPRPPRPAPPVHGGFPGVPPRPPQGGAPKRPTGGFGGFGGFGGLGGFGGSRPSGGFGGSRPTGGRPLGGSRPSGGGFSRGGGSRGGGAGRR